MDQNDIDKITRINLIIHNISTKAENEGVSTITGYKSIYGNYYNLIEPIILRYPQYQLEFNAIIKPDMGHHQIVLAYISLRRP